MASCIEFIRKRYHVPAKIGRMVTYNGRLYRIAWAQDGALILRDEVRVHPGDPGLDYLTDEHVCKSCGAATEGGCDLCPSCIEQKVLKQFGAE
jgi:hypothetical protein